MADLPPEAEMAATETTADQSGTASTSALLEVSTERADKDVQPIFTYPSATETQQLLLDRLNDDVLAKPPCALGAARLRCLSHGTNGSSFESIRQYTQLEANKRQIRQLAR